MSDRRTNTAARTVPEARSAILAAAQALYRRGGTDAVTLSAVAQEADFARGVVYAHYSSRQELIAALQASIAPPAAAEPQGSQAPAGENYDELMRAQAEVLQELSKQVIVAKPAQRDATETALTRFDARLTLNEQAIAALEQRTGERLKNLDRETGALAERFHGLRQRLEKFEERQVAALAQLRLDVHNLGRATGHEAPIAPQPVSEAEPDIVTPPDAEVAPQADDASPPARMADYLISARRAALDAAERDAAAKPVRRKSAWKRLLGKRRWAVLAAAAVLVAWFDIYVFAHYQPAEGAVVPAALPVIPHPLKAHAEWSPRAQLVRGLKYLNGTGVPVDVEKARAWIERAALRGQPVAENLMGVLNQTGTGDAVNMPVAIGWYEGAAKHGNLKAMTNLGKIYAGGWPDGTDFTKAAEWFAKAAARGEVDAAFDLAVLYERGEGVSRNLAQAYKWYAIAAARGDSHAGVRAATLSLQITPEEREAADAAATAFSPAAADKEANEAPTVQG